MATGDSPPFGDLLRRYRLAAGLSQEMLAERAGISARSVSDLERGIYRAPHRDTVALLGEALALAAEDRARLEHAVQRRRGPLAAVPPTRVALGRGITVPPTPLLGRDPDVAALTALLQRAEVRLVTLTGPGGVGKTRLGLQVAAALATAFADGVVCVPLAAIVEPALMAATIAQELGLKESSSRPVADHLMEYLAAKRLLLVLDNLEQVRDAAPLVADLLTACQGLTMLVTSRARLRVRGEHEVVVPPLALPPPASALDPTSLSRYAAVALFLARAQEIKADVALTDETAAAVVEICRRLDGLPLAIELAAAWIKLFTPQALLGRLERPLTLLTGGARDLPARQRTLRDTLAWSYDLLDLQEQMLFRRLGVFVGGWTLEAAEAICTTGGDFTGDVLAGIASLVDASVLRQEEPPARADPEGEPRFGMLETIRAYALEQLAAHEEAAALHQAHATYFLALAEEAEPQLAGAAQAAWLGCLAREHDNLRAALRWSLESGAVEPGVRLAGALWRFWWVHGHLSEGRRWLAEVLALAGQGHDAAVVAKALYGAAELACRQGDYARALALGEQSLQLYRKAQDRRGIAAVLNVMGIVANDQGAYERAAALHEESLAVRQELGDQWGIAGSLNNLGAVAQQQGAYDRAATFYEQSLALRRALGDHWGLAIALNNLGLVARRQGAYDRALALHEEGLAVTQTLGNRWGIAASLLHLAETAFAQGAYAHAADRHRESLRIGRALGDKHLVAYNMEGLAAAVAAQGQTAHAARLYAAATTLREAIGAPLAPTERSGYEHAVAALRGVLGDDAFAAAWAAGQALSLEEVIAEDVGPTDGI